MSVRAHGGKISGAPGTVFDVAQDKAKTTVTVVKGSVVLSEGGLLAPRSDRYTRAQKTQINKNRILYYGLGGLQFANGRKFQNNCACPHTV